MSDCRNVDHFNGTWNSFPLRDFTASPFALRHLITGYIGSGINNGGFPRRGISLQPSHRPLNNYFPQEVELSAESLVLCVDVSWSLGEQSFCKEKLEGWALRGLDSGDYNVRVTLHEVIKLSAEDTGARTRVVAEARRGFRVQLEHEEEKVQITWPRGRETITVGEVQKVEVSFRTQAFEGVVEGGRVCLGNTALGDGQYGCVGSGDNWAAVRVKEGWNEVQAILVDGEGRKREGEWTTHSAGFWVEFSGDAGKG